jgi:hypothetical protein
MLLLISAHLWLPITVLVNRSAKKARSIYFYNFLLNKIGNFFLYFYSKKTYFVNIISNFFANISSYKNHFYHFYFNKFNSMYNYN